MEGRSSMVSAEQTYELEEFFKECQYPTDKERLELGRRLGMETSQVKFWFQNRTTQLKAELKRCEMAALEMENVRLREEAARKESKGKSLCPEYGGPVLEENSLNTKDRIAGNGPLGLSHGRSDITTDLCLGKSVQVWGVDKPRNGAASTSSIGLSPEVHLKSMHIQRAVSAMNELMVLAHQAPLIWVKGLDGKYMFNNMEYSKRFPHHGKNPFGSPDACEFSIASGILIDTSSELVMRTIMDPIRWAEMFPCMIGKISDIEVLCVGARGTHDGEMLMMDAEIIYPSPSTALRCLRFIRHCKRYPDGAWAVVDVSLDPTKEDYTDLTRRCRKLPSGFLVRELPNGNSQVTVVEHYEYDDTTSHCALPPIMLSGLCSGAERWLVTLQQRAHLIPI